MIAKTFMAATAALLLLAIAVVGSAQAEPLVASATGETPEEVTLLSENTEINAGAGVLLCRTTQWVLKKPTQNVKTTFHEIETGTAQGGITTGHKGECELVPFGIKVKVTTLWGTTHLKQGGTGNLDVEYIYDITHPVLGSILCVFKESTTLTYVEGSDTLSLSGSLTGEGGPACPTSGSISGTFTVTDENGEPVVIE